MSGTEQQTSIPAAPASSEAAPASRTADREAGRPVDNATCAAEAITEEVDNARDLRISIAVRYYGARASFFNNWARASVIISAVGGSAAFGAIVGNITFLAPLAALSVVIISLTDLAVGFKSSADRANDLFVRYRDLESAIRLHQIEPAAIASMLHDIERTEPPTLDALQVRYHNIECEYRHQFDDVFPMRWWQNLFAQYLTLPPNKFRPSSNEPSSTESGG